MCDNQDLSQQPHSQGWAKVPLSWVFFPSNFDQFFLLIFSSYLFSSSFWASGWASRPSGGGKALAIRMPLVTMGGGGANSSGRNEGGFVYCFKCPL